MKESTGQEPIKSIKEKIYELKRNSLKRKLTGNLGKVVETEDKLICYVDKNKCEKEKYGIIIPCCGIHIKDRELARKYRLDKPICYVIDGFDIKSNGVCIFGYRDCEVLIKNCHFGRNFYASIDGKCTLENTSIDNPLLATNIYAKTLIIKDTTITNKVIFETDCRNITIRAKERLELINSTVKIKGGTTTIKSGISIGIYNSKITGDKVKCSANYIVSNPKSWITARDKIDFEVPDFYEITVCTPMLNCIGTAFSNLTKPMILKKIPDTLSRKRLELLAQLNNLKNKVLTKNNEDVITYQTSLNNSPIKKVLSKQH